MRDHAPNRSCSSKEGVMTRPPRGLPLLLSVLALAWFAVVGLAAPALAHEGEEEVPARTQVATADAILRTQPEQVELAADRINDALEAEDHEGVDLGRVEQAKAALAADDMLKTELLLEQALGACPGEPVTKPAGVRAKLPQSPCPTPAHELALGRVPVHGSTKPVLLGIGALLALGGLALAWRIR
jgi:hypothetical protein